GVVTTDKMANSDNPDQVLITDTNGVPTWTDQSIFENIYTADGTLTGQRTVSGTEKWLTFKGDNGNVVINGNLLRSENNDGAITDLFYSGNTARLEAHGKADKLSINTNTTEN